MLDETGLLPHLNPGVLTRGDLVRFRRVSASLGLMLETSSARLSERGGPHFGSPDKLPARRRTLVLAGGRDPLHHWDPRRDRRDALERIASLLAIAEVQRRYGHIQEVIVQNFRAKAATRMAAAPEPSLDEHLWSIAAARTAAGRSARPGAAQSRTTTSPACSTRGSTTGAASRP